MAIGILPLALLGIAAILALVPVSVRLLKSVLLEEEHGDRDEPAPAYQQVSRTQETDSHDGTAG